MVVHQDDGRGVAVQGHPHDLPHVDDGVPATAGSSENLVYQVVVVVQQQHPALLVLQPLEPGYHQLPDAPRRDQRRFDHGGLLLQEAPSQFEGGEHAGRLPGADARQGEHLFAPQVEQGAEPSAGKAEQLPGQVEGAPRPGAAAQQHRQQFAVAEGLRTAGEHFFARPFVRAQFLDFHSGARIGKRIVKNEKKNAHPRKSALFLSIFAV